MERSERAALLSTAFNLALVGAKGGLSILSGSLALLADAIHSFADVISAFALFVGLKLAKRKTRSFPYGLYKLENLIALATSFLIFTAGYEILKGALSRNKVALLRHLHITLPGFIAIMGAMFLFSRYQRKVAEETGSPAIAADSAHIKADFLSSTAILISLITNLFGINIDRFAAIIVVLFIGKAALEIFIGSMRVLLDASIDFETMDRIKELISSYPLVAEVRALSGRSSGRYKFIEAELIMRTDELSKAHRAAEEIETLIKREIPLVDHIVIHPEPMRKEKLIYAIPLADKRGTISEHYGEAPLFALIEVKTKDFSVEGIRIIENPYLNLERGKGIKVSEWLVGEGVDKVRLKEAFHGGGPTYVFSDAGVEVKFMKATNIKEFLKEEGLSNEKGVMLLG